MSVINILKECLHEEIDETLLESKDEFKKSPKNTGIAHAVGSTSSIVEDDEGGSVDGDPQALVDCMIQNAPGQHTQIGVLLKYAANTNPAYDIWDSALDYFESLADDVEAVKDDLTSDEESLDVPEDGEDETLPDDLMGDDDDDEFSL